MNIPCKACPVGWKPDLPVGYIKADFLEATGTQYIDTGFSFNNDTGIACTFIYTDPRKNMNVIAGRTDNTNDRLYSPYFGAEGSWTIGYGHYIITGIQAPSPFTTICSTSTNFKNDKKLLVQEKELWDLSTYPAFSCPYNLYIFGACVGSRASNFLIGRIYNAQFSQEENIAMQFIPAISPDGTPCMYDSISGEAKLNVGTGSFIVGLTASQALNLSNLPEKTASLTISLPASIVSGSTITDAQVASAIETARSKGWTITVQTYTE